MFWATMLSVLLMMSVTMGANSMACSAVGAVSRFLRHRDLDLYVHFWTDGKDCCASRIEARTASVVGLLVGPGGYRKAWTAVVLQCVTRHMVANVTHGFPVRWLYTQIHRRTDRSSWPPPGLSCTLLMYSPAINAFSCDAKHTSEQNSLKHSPTGIPRFLTRVAHLWLPGSNPVKGETF